MRRYLAFSAVTTVVGLCAVVWTVQPASAAPARALVGNTTTTLSASPNPATTSDSITLTATITSSAGTPTGDVTFYMGHVKLGTATVDGSGHASYSGLTVAKAGSYSLTASYEDPTFTSFNPSSGTATLTVGSAAPTVHPTNVALSVNPTSLQTGQSATLTATVTASDGDPGIPTGSVEFYDNGNDLGGATLNGSGVATLTSSGYIAGTNAITATYAGDSTHSGATSSAVDISATNPVTVYGTTTSLSASPSTVQTGGTETLTATVSGNGGGTPTGSVQFYDNDQPIGNSIALNGSGVASLSWTGFTAGSHSLSAKYQGDSTHHTSTSTQTSITANAPTLAVTTSITSSISPNPIAEGGSATLSAHVQQVGTQLPPPQGSIVTFRNAANGALIGQATLDASGNGSVVTSGWQPGTYKITATYNGDANNAPASGQLSVTVRPLTPLTVTGPSPTVSYGSGIPTLPPTYSGFVNGDTASSLTTQATCTTAATGSAPAVGTYIVTCSGASDPYYRFVYASGTLTVQKAPLTVTPPTATMKEGDPVPTLTPTITGFVNSEVLATSDVTGSAACTTTATSSSTTGPYPITCTLGTLASNNYSFSIVGHGTLTVIAPGSVPTTSSVMTEGPILVGSSVDLTGRLATRDTGTYLANEPLTLALGSQSCTGTTNTSGQATCSVTPPRTSTLGPATITASFAGDNTYAPSTGSRSVILYTLLGSGGAFVVGDESSAHSTSVTFWDSQWWKANEVSQGDPSQDFKGYADSAGGLQLGSTWSTSPANSSSPPSAPLPSYMGVIVTSSTTQSGSSISGTVCNVAVVQTNSGYAPDPGHSGTGTIVGSVKPLASCSGGEGSSGSSDQNGSGSSSSGSSSGHESNGSGSGNGHSSLNDYANSASTDTASNAHWTRHGYTSCPAL